MKYSGIGGQAVLEGIMMKNKDRYAVAVRKADGTIEVMEQATQAYSDTHKWAKWPIVRGVVSFIESLSVGFSTLMWSGSFAEDENGNKVELSKTEQTFTIILGVVLAIAIFTVLPTLILNFLKTLIPNEILLAFLEGILRLAIFIGYIAAVSLMPDIKRTFMYHGSEHKCINCLEHGLPLTVENVMKSSKEHRRCGTSFLLIVMLISIVFFMIIRFDNLALKMVSRILLIPVIAGVSFEILRFTGNHDNKFTYIISRPGMWMQGLTTKEPTADMVEVAIAAVEKVFDWKQFLTENYGLEFPEEEEPAEETMAETVKEEENA